MRRQSTTTNRGFTMIEMLVVISMIVLLISILLPSMQKSKYEARVVTCLANFHQWGIAMTAYAGEHGGDALPRQDEPFTTGVNTWDVSNRFPEQMGRYGVNMAKMWDCPVSPLVPQSVSSFDDAKAYFKSAYGYFSIIPFNLWVPRKFGAVFFPSPAYDALADPKGWPERISSRNAGTQPVLSDRVSKSTAHDDTPETASGGHQWVGKLESTTLLFADSHAERRPVAEVKRRYSGNLKNFY
ncbi:MAG: type II secretion system protein [Phycisphaeraceae bacterium]